MLKRSKRPLVMAGLVAAAAIVAIPHAMAAQESPRMVPLRTVPVVESGGDRIIVKYRAATPAARSLNGKLAVVDNAAARAVVATARPSVPASMRPATSSHLRQMAVGADVIKLSRKLSRAELENLVRELSVDPAVEHVEIDERMYPLLTPNDQLYAQYQWHFHNTTGGIRAPEAWDVSSGAGVVVAVLDTGVLPNHPDLAANLLPGYDFISDPFVSRRATEDRVPGGVDLGDWNDDAGECAVSGSSWHGTHVSGTVAQVTNNEIGVAGVAFNARVLPVRVLGRCGGYKADIADAIVWASGGAVVGVENNENPAEVINLSLGGARACDVVYQSAIDIAVKNGSVVVVAAGNSNSDVKDFSPAGCENVISVGASRITGGKASYSNYGAKLDIAAPGGGGSQDTGHDGWDGYVLQSNSKDTKAHSGNYAYAGMAGTSMAAPHVAGVAALVQSALVGKDKAPLSAADLEELLKKTARSFPVSIPAATPLGAGIVNAKAALDEALKEPCQVDCGPVTVELVNKVEKKNLSNKSNDGVYTFNAVAGQVLSFLTMGGTGDVSIYASFGEIPTEAKFHAKSTRAGNSETIRFTAPKAGIYYVRLAGTYSGLTLVARQ